MQHVCVLTLVHHRGVYTALLVCAEYTAAGEHTQSRVFVLLSLSALYVCVFADFTLRVPAARQHGDGFSCAAHPQFLKVHMHDGGSAKSTDHRQKNQHLFLRKLLTNHRTQRTH